MSNYKGIPPYAWKQIAKAMAEEPKQEDDRDWTDIMNDFEDLYQQFKAGKDFNCETGVYTLAHCLVKGIQLIESYRTKPHKDNRYKPYLNTKKIVLDVDDVVADFITAFCAKYNLEPSKYWDSDYDIASKLEEIAKDPDFYVGLKVKHFPNFIPHAYVSARSIPVEWTKKFLEINGLPCRPVYHVPWNASKVDTLKKIETDIFIDDKFSNFAEAQKAGITSFLMDAPHNQHYDVGYRRLKNLDIKNIIR